MRAPSMLAYATRNKAADEEFLARNGQEKGVKTTASGLQYKVLAAGDTKAPAISATDQVTVNYRGKLIDGTEFDSSYSRGTPATFPRQRRDQGLAGSVGPDEAGREVAAVRTAELAYGANPRPGIPANSLLIFDVELLSAKPNAGSPQAAPPRAANPRSAQPEQHVPPSEAEKRDALAARDRARW